MDLAWEDPSVYLTQTPITSFEIKPGGYLQPQCIQRATLGILPSDVKFRVATVIDTKVPTPTLNTVITFSRHPAAVLANKYHLSHCQGHTVTPIPVDIPCL